ncbi:putative glycerophosphoryl diester phosphodiesterase [Methanocella paludicola SANAE]|uniref:Glycerophosphoryl diester phosphodiesterase n=1 Tax=Methanocella paludicola (strain DSM 17711 / JCM 13418 / NBRC 101707 / SANAE) TaxID=304371 RepID=D1Z1C7_METPS|nr:glycerophosphodiester phosphodiesterase family protein [Methanocella paludicola]BAI62499.1 putative glycerophosphoryl diester phosphodiesterase [Methanocella paludicola SANAE]
MYQIVGHRGAPRQAPENTMLSFKRAIDIGVDWIEFDLRKTKDGVLVVIHDEKVDRTTNGEGMIRDMTLEGLQGLDAGDGQRIPSLAEVIALAKGRVGMDMEIKEAGTEEDVVDAILRSDIKSSCMVSSFILDSVKLVKEMDSGITTAAIMDKMPDDPRHCLDMLSGMRADAVMLSKKIATPPFVGQIRRQGLKVGIWNADTLDEIEKFAAMDPYYLCSNYPERLVEFRQVHAVI